MLPIVFRHSQSHVSLDSRPAFSASLLVVSPSFRFFTTDLLHCVSVVLVSTPLSFPISASLYFPPARSFPMVQTDFYSWFMYDSDLVPTLPLESTAVSHERLDSIACSISLYELVASRHNQSESRFRSFFAFDLSLPRVAAPELLTPFRSIYR